MEDFQQGGQVAGNLPVVHQPLEFPLPRVVVLSALGAYLQGQGLPCKVLAVIDLSVGAPATAAENGHAVEFCAGRQEHTGGVGMVGRKRNARIYHESCVPRRGAPLPSSCPPAVRCVLKQGKSRRRPARDAGGERGHPLHARCSIRDGKCHGGAMRRPWAHVGHGGAQPDTCLCLRLSMPPPPPDDGNDRVSAGLPRPRTPANGDVVRAIRPMKPRK